VLKSSRANKSVLLGIAAALAMWVTVPAEAQRLIIKPSDPAANAAPVLLAQAKADAPSPRILQRLGTNRLRHGSRILALAYSPNGQDLAAGGGSDPVRIWDASTGQQKFTCNDTWVNAIAYSPRGSLIITAGAFKTIRMWSAANDKDAGKESGKLEGHAAPIKALALSPGGDLLVSGSQDGVIMLWEMLTKKKIIEIKEHTDEITALAYCTAHDNDLFVSGSNDRTVRVWDGGTQKLKIKIDAGCGVLAVALAPDGKTVYSAGDDNFIRAWDVETGKPTAMFKGHDNMVVSLSLSRDGKTLISGGRDNTIRIWDLQAQGKPPRVIARHFGDSDALAVSKDGKRVATAGLNNTIRVFDTATGNELFGSNDPQAGLNGLTLSRNGKYLAAITAPGIVYLWDAPTGKLLRDWKTGQTGEIALGFSADGKSLVTADRTIRFWDPETGKQRFELPKDDVKMAPALSIAFAPDGKTVAVGMRGGQVAIWDIDARSITGSFAYSQDSKLLGVSGGSKIILFDRAANKELRRFDCKDAPPKTLLPDVAALAFCPDKRTLAVACWDGVIRILNFADGKEVSACEGHQSVPFAIEYSRDGRTLLSGSADTTVRLWEPFSGVQIAELKGHTGEVHGVALSPDGKTAYSAAADTNVLVWDTTGFGKAGPLKAALGNAELETAWKELANDNAGAARLTMWRLIVNSDGVAPFLKTKVPLVDVPRIKKLLADLDSDQFDERDAAFKELANQGRWLEDRLEEALLKTPSLEYKRRIEQLQDKLRVAGALTLRQEQIRLRRTMMVLEYIADAPARDLLDRLSRQAPSDALCDDATKTLDRLGKLSAKTAGASR
jgi:WD40 repeat protein